MILQRMIMQVFTLEYSFDSSIDMLVQVFTETNEWENFKN